MTVKAILNLDQNRLLWGETTKGTTKIINDGDTTLEYLNFENDRALPTFVLTDLQKADVTDSFQQVLPGAANYEIMLKPGETWETNFELCYKIKFPRAGSFEIKTRFEWYGASTESEPFKIEILPASPRARSLETTGGGPVGDLFCAWVNAGENGSGELRLLSIGAVSEARFQKSLRLCEIPVNAQPILSVPPNTSPTNQFVGWIDGQTLKYIVHRFGQISAYKIPLDDNNYKIIPPLLEDPFNKPSEKQNADALLMRETDGGWEMRVLTLGDASALSQPVKAQGPIPVQSYTAYRSDTERRTIFWEQNMFSAEKAAVALSVSNWAAGKVPQAPKLKAAWEGKFVAADQSLTDDDAVIGAVLLHLETDNKNNYELRRWKIDSNDIFTESPAVRINWNPETVITEAVLRIRADEYVFALLRSAEDDLWRVLAEDGELKLLPENLQNITGKVNIFFVNQSVPAILYTDPECGLRIAFDGPAPKRFSPAGARI